MNEPTQTPSQKQPVLLQVVPKLASGGVERGTIEIAGAAARAGFISLVASEGGAMERQLKESGVEFFHLPLAGKSPLTIYKNITALAEIITKHKVDIVHARSRAPAWSAYCAAKKTGVHFITTFHGVYGHGNLLKRLYNSVMTKGEKVIAISQFVSRHIQKIYHIPESRIRVIYRGVDLDYFNPAKVDQQKLAQLKEAWNLKEDWPVILMPARYTRWKGHLELLGALTRLSHEQYYCVMLGHVDGHEAYFEEVQQRVIQYRLEKHVRMEMATKDMREVYALADVVTCPSQEPEAFGRVAIEAQAMGKPVVASRLGGYSETILHEVTGRLVDSFGSEGLAKALDRGINLDLFKKEALETTCRAHVAEHFPLSKMCDDTIALYQELLGAV